MSYIIKGSRRTERGVDVEYRSCCGEVPSLRTGGYEVCQRSREAKMFLSYKIKWKLCGAIRHVRLVCTAHSFRVKGSLGKRSCVRN